MQAAGPCPQTLTWAVKSGDWTVVAMNADGSRPVSMQVNVAATLPALPWIATGLLSGGFAFLGRRRPADRGPAAEAVLSSGRQASAPIWMTCSCGGSSSIGTGPGFVALAVWPGGAWRRGPSVPWALHPAVCAGAVAVLLALLAWFGAELVAGAGQAGLAELVLGVVQAVWPLMVVLSCRRPVRTAAGSPICTASTSERGRPGPEHGIKAGIDAHHHRRAA